MGADVLAYVFADVLTSLAGCQQMADHVLTPPTDAPTHTPTDTERENIRKNQTNTYIFFFSLQSVGNVCTGVARGPFSTRKVRLSASAHRARENANTKKDNPGRGKGRQSNSAVDPIRSCRRTIYPIGPGKSTGQTRNPAFLRYFAPMSGDKGLSAGGSSPAPSRRQGAGRSAANKETLFLSGKSRKGKRHG